MQILSDNRFFLKLLFTISVTSGAIYFAVLMIVWLKLFSLPTPHGFSWEQFTFGSDLHLILDAVQAFFRGYNPYNQPYSYKYSPLFAYLFFPLTLLSFEQAYLIISMANILLLLVTVVFIARLLRLYGISFERKDEVLLFVAIFFFQPWSACLILGQIGNTVILCFLSIFWYCIVYNKRGASIISNSALLVATLLKVFPIAFLLFELYLKKWKQALTFVIALLLVSIVSIIVFGVPIHVEWVKTMADVQTNIQGGNASVYAIMLAIASVFKVNNTVLTKEAWAVLCALVGLLVVYYVLKKTEFLSHRTVEIDILVFSSIALFMITLPFHCFSVYAVFLIPSFVLFVYKFALAQIEKIGLVFCLVSIAFNMYFYLGGNFLGGTFALVAANGPNTAAYGILVLMLFVILRLRRHPMPKTTKNHSLPVKSADD